jgi:protein gp37
MGDKTKIEWTDATWNPIIGCSRVSEGCRHCYAERMSGRFPNESAYSGLTKIVNGRAVWTGQIKETKKLREPLKWKPVVEHAVGCLRKDDKGNTYCGCSRPRRIFVNSMSDLFHENVTDRMRDRIFAVMALCPQHTFQVLTKRPERMLKYFTEKHLNPQQWPAEEYDVQTCIRLSMGGLLKGKALSNGRPDVMHFFKSGHADRYGEADLRVFKEWPLRNVWLGVSVENQAAADERIPLLLQTPAAVRFISAEPLLGEVDLTFLDRQPTDEDRQMPGFENCAAFYLDALWGRNSVVMQDCAGFEEAPGTRPKLDWVICGGESGPGAQPMHPDWARSLRGQCQAAGVPFFFKQWGEWLGAMQDGNPCLNDQALNCSDAPERVGKIAAGALLDGREWKQFPEVRA